MRAALITVQARGVANETSWRVERCGHGRRSRWRLLFEGPEQPAHARWQRAAQALRAGGSVRVMLGQRQVVCVTRP